MGFHWARFTGERPRDIAAAWAYMRDNGSTAIGSVFEMRDGKFKVIYSVVGQLTPHVDGPFASLQDAKLHMEFVSTVKVLRPRVVILDQAFG